MTKTHLIDSNLWHYAYIIPDKEEWEEIHQKASAFLEAMLTDSDAVIAMSEYQIAEIMELLRKGHMPPASRKKIFAGFDAPKFHIVPLSRSILNSAFQKSLTSGIHIYDYLVALPLKGIVDTLYSADDHFQHPHFREIAPVSNPLKPWILTEGKPPLKKSTD